MEELTNKKRKVIVKDIIKSLQFASYPPDYNEDYLFYMQKRRDFAFNCYAYAMQFRFDAHDLVYLHQSYPYNPGVLSGIKNYRLPKDYYTLMEYFLQDCRILGIDIDFTTMDEKSDDDSYKVAILLADEINPVTQVPNYHFIRQNSDLSWSEMECFTGEVFHTEPEKYKFKTLEIVKVKKLTRGD